MIRFNKELLDFFSELNDPDLVDFATRKRFDPKETIIEQGEKNECVYIIKSGIAKCYRLEENGDSFIQEFFSQGEIFGEIEMFIEEENFGFIEAVTDLIVYKISRKNFHRKLEEDRRFNHLILKALATKIKYKAIRHSFNQLNSIEPKLLRLKRQFPEFLTTLSKSDIANYLGITERSLNRTLKGLKEKNLMD